MSNPSHENLIGTSILGWRRVAPGAESFHATDPANAENLAPDFYSASTDDLETAAHLAATAFRPYAALSAQRRGEFLRAIAAEIEAIGDLLIARVMSESALPEARVRSERARTCFQLRFYAGIVEEGSWVDARIDLTDPSAQPVPTPDLRSMLRPLGPVAVFGASNFPLAYSVAGGDTATALAAGCPVIMLAHYSHPGTSELIGAAIQRAARAQNMPEGVFSMLFADGGDSGKKIGAALVRHPAITAVGFTGSRAGGAALLRIAQARPVPIPFYAEMSSVNPVIILPHAMKNRGAAIVSGLHKSITLHSGQFCTNPGLVLLDRSAPAQEFAQTLSAKMNATASAAMLNQTIRNAYNSAVQVRASTPDIRTLAQAPKGENSCQTSAALFEVDAAAFTSDPNLQAEIFGPSSLLIRYQSGDELLRAVDCLEGNLTATIHMDEADLPEALVLLEHIEAKAGRVVFNGYPTGVEVCQSMVHGGPWPSTSDSRSTSVGGRAIERFARPVCYQNAPPELLPPELRDGNPHKILRMLNGQYQRD